MALAVWVRVLLPQILGSTVPAASAAAAPSRAANAAAGDRAPGQQPAPQQQPQQLSETLTVKAFQYLDGLLASPAVKHDMQSGISVRDGQPPVPLVPPAPLLALIQAVHQPGRLQGDTALLSRSHQVTFPRCVTSCCSGQPFAVLALDAICAASHPQRKAEAAPHKVLIWW